MIGYQVSDDISLDLILEPAKDFAPYNAALCDLSGGVLKVFVYLGVRVRADISIVLN